MRIRKTWIRNWILRRAVLAFAVVALIVPTAAQGARGGGVPRDATVAAKLVGPHQQPALPCAPNCAVDEGQVKVAHVTQVASSGFDWGDAAIGAGIALGLVLLGATAFRATRGVGKPQTA
jgi:hypothetical protein